MPTSRLDEFIIALHDEITYVRKSKGKAYYLSQGSLQRRLGEYFIYNFLSHRPFTTADDTPAKLELDDASYDCSVVSSQGLELQIAVKSPLGERVTAARLTHNQSEVLDRLVEKFEQAKRTRSNPFILAEDVFIGRTRVLAATGQGPAGTRPPDQFSAGSGAGSLSGSIVGSLTAPGGGSNMRASADIDAIESGYPRYSYDADNPPNDSQKLAILNSFTNSLAVIWGPPGTGKTSTIARAAEAHLNAGRRVLFVSHANTAVDAALMHIANQVKETFYKNGTLLRLGVPKDPNLEQQYPLVVAEHQVEMATSSLLTEHTLIEQAILPLQARVSNCDRLLVVIDKVKELERKIQKPEESPTAKMLQRRQQLQSEIDHAETQLTTAQKHLRAVLGPAVYTYETVIKDLNIFINVRKRMIEELNTKLAAHTDSESYEEALERAYEELDEMMNITGLDPNEAIKSKKESQIILTELQTKLGPIKQKISEAQGQMVSRARLVATTLSKVFCSSALDKEMFDILIVDEASMVSMPSLFWALSKVSQGVTIVGDFKQLPPIVMAKTDMASKWLRRNIFDELRIGSVDAARKNARVSILDTQYRMTGKITDIANQLFYGGLLKNASGVDSQSLTDSISGDSALAIIDTSAVNHHCTQPPEGSRINIYSAGLCATLCQKLLLDHPTATIGVATPYRAQADLIDEMLVDSDLQGRVQVSTVHKFQGGQSTIVIFDCVDCLGAGHSSLDDRLKDSSAEVLLNVALTRARSKFYLVVNKTYFFNSMSGDSLILQFIAALGANGKKIESRSIDDNFTARSIEADAPARATKDSSTPGSLFNERNFWDAFFSDLISAKKSAVIVSPFVTTKRSRTLVPRIESLVARGVKVRVHTKPIGEHSQAYMSEDAAQVISLLEQMGVEVVQQPEMHQKVAIIDDQICWEGSLNILSHTGSTLEHMRRLVGRATAAEIKNNLRL
jgi:hypothetical protein